MTWRPTRVQVLWAISLAIILLILLLGGRWLWVMLEDYVAPRTATERKDLVHIFVLIAGGVVGALTALAAVGNFYMSRRNLQQQRDLDQRRAQDEALQAYFKQIGDLLTAMNLAETKDNKILMLARAQTFTVLGTLDGDRKRLLINFLYGAGLIHKSTLAISLKDADLSEANLYKANLEFADLSIAKLERARLDHATLYDADLLFARLQGAKLSNANLRGADLRDANLEAAILDHADLRPAESRRWVATGEDAPMERETLENMRPGRWERTIYGPLPLDLKNDDNDDFYVHREYYLTADLLGADLRRADLEGADLRYANLFKTKLEEANLTRSNLKYAMARDIERDDRRTQIEPSPRRHRTAPNEHFKHARSLKGATMPDGYKQRR